MRNSSNDPHGKLPWTTDTFFEQLRQAGQAGYYDRHLFHLLLQDGKLPLAAIRLWIRNRFYYQSQIPVKDAFILANSPLEVRRIWIHRITDHDGDNTTGKPGGIRSWVRLDLGVSGEAPVDFGSISPAEQDAVLQAHQAKLDLTEVLPGVRHAVNEYVAFAREQRWELAVASSLTEMFAPDLMIRRLASLELHYPLIPSWSYDYFRNRPPQARRDREEAWALLAERCKTLELQLQAVAALKFKCGILWKMLDAIMDAGEDIDAKNKRSVCQ